ncbi:ROK family glucokinase [Alkalicoccus chagannorensis]|uniref:ROK family glucokinase n=1 Tax=Alkalicoccus chagannorensis TaxID=427072 RepID=UPI00041720A2|nr:ROK family glucokinase [Alkalicoccus chagannorensis]
MTQSVIAAADVGGTTVKLAFVTVEGDIIDKWEINTNQAEKGRYIMAETADALLHRAAQLDLDIEAAGVGAPGFIDVERGYIYEAVNVGWKDYPLADELSALLQVPVRTDNDANLAAAGEKWKGAGDGADNMLAVTLGTGVGGGIISDGRIVHGVSGMAGEIGHITAVRDDGFLCNCGKTGCLETVSSATGIARLGSEAAKRRESDHLHQILQHHGAVTAKDVLEGAAAGDEGALRVLRTSLDHLGFALANLCNSLNPSTIVLGGGVSKAGDFLITELRPFFDAYAIPKIAEDTHMRIAALGNDAGVLGAAWIAKDLASVKET